MAAPTRTPPETAARRFGTAIVVVIAGLVALNLIARGVDHAVGGSDPRGVAGSAYGTQATGLAGLAELLAHYGHPVSFQRGPLIDAELDPSATVFVIEPQSLTEDDATVLLQFASAGGQLVIGGPEPFYLHRLRDQPPVWDADGKRFYNEIDPRLGDLREVETAGNGSWKSAGSGDVLVQGGGVALLTADAVGRGAISFLADASPLENAHLARADNAAFALGLAGDGSRPVQFVEGVHGYGARRGVSAVPTPWKVALALLALAALVLAWSRSRRFGPPDRPSRELAPARAEYVRALATSLERTRQPSRALEPLQQWARSHIAQRAHLRADASPEAIDRAAIALGLSESERAAIWYPPNDDATALELGRLVSRLSQPDGRTP